MAPAGRINPAGQMTFLKRKKLNVTDESSSGSSTSPWIKAGVVFLALAVIGIGFLVYEASQPTIDDAFREAAETQFGEDATTVKADLALLSTAQEEFREKNGRFARSVDEFEYFFSSDGVEITILRADSSGWKAEGRHEEVGIACTATDETRMGSGGRFWAECRQF